MRMVYVASGMICTYSQTFGRTAKPFMPLLGETFEYLTKNIKFYGEAVSYDPPVVALNIESEFYNINRVAQPSLKFNGTSIAVIDHNITEFVIKTTGERDSERFTSTNANLKVGNIFGIGSRYIKP